MNLDQLLNWLRSHINQGSLVAIGMLALAFAAYHGDNPKAWIIALAGLAAVVGVFFFYRPTPLTMEQHAWFKAIEKHLRDASHATIYLRVFQHPDDFKSDNRDALLGIMNSFVKNIIEHPDTFRLVAYREFTQAGKDPVQWMRSEIQRRQQGLDADASLRKCVKIIDRQPVANTSTVYVIDNAILLFSHVATEEKVRLYSLDLTRSLLPHFVVLGIDHLWRRK